MEASSQWGNVGSLTLGCIEGDLALECSIELALKCGVERCARVVIEEEDQWSGWASPANMLPEATLVSPPHGWASLGFHISE